MVLEGSAKRRLAGHVASDANALGIESWRHAYRCAFRFFEDRFQAQRLFYDFSATGVDYTGGGTDIGIRIGRDLFLEKVDEASFALEHREDQEARGVDALGGQFNGFGFGLDRLRFTEQWNDLSAEIGVAQGAQEAGKCRAQAGKKSRLSLVFHIKADGTATAAWAYRPLQPHGTPIIAWGTWVFCGKGSRGKIAAVLVMCGADLRSAGCGASGSARESKTSCAGVLFLVLAPYPRRRGRLRYFRR